MVDPKTGIELLVERIAKGQVPVGAVAEFIEKRAISVVWLVDKTA